MGYCIDQSNVNTDICAFNGVNYSMGSTGQCVESNPNNCPFNTIKGELYAIQIQQIVLIDHIVQCVCVSVKCY